jgi:hypothetical protein
MLGSFKLQPCHEQFEACCVHRAAALRVAQSLSRDQDPGGAQAGSSASTAADGLLSASQSSLNHELVTQDPPISSTQGHIGGLA